MRLTVQNANNDQIFELELEDDATIEDLKVLISVETGLPVEQQFLLANGKPLQNDTAKIKSYGVNNYDMVVLTSARLMQTAAGFMGPGAGLQPQRQPPRTQVPSVSNVNDANLLNNFFQDLSQKPIAIPTSARRQGGLNFD